MKKIHILFILLLTALLVTACAKEPLVETESGGEYKLEINTRALVGGVLDGVTISKVRFLLRDSRYGRVVLNSTTDNGQLTEVGDKSIQITVPLGYYEYYIIVNEPDEVTEQFKDRIGNINAAFLKGLVVPSKENFDTEANVTLQQAGSITISKDISTPGRALATTKFNTTPQNPVTIELEHTQAKVSLFLRKGDAVLDEEGVVIQKVEIVNTPTEASLFTSIGGMDHLVVNDDPSFWQTFTPYNGPDLTLTKEAGTVEKEGKKYHDIFRNRIIASKTMASPTDPTNATYIVIYAIYRGVPCVYRVPLSKDGSNYNVLRGGHYKVYASITQAGLGIVTMEILPWNDGGTIDVIEKPIGDILLNVSELSAWIEISKRYDGGKTIEKEIHFWSSKNYEEVTVIQDSIVYTEGLDYEPKAYTFEGYAQYIEDNPYAGIPQITLSSTKVSDQSGYVNVALKTAHWIGFSNVAITFYIKVRNLHRKITVTYNARNISS